MEGLSRTLLLLQDHVPRDVRDSVIADALLRTQVAVVGDRLNLGTEAGQHALVTSALLAARCGASVHVVVPDLPLLGAHPPLRGDRLEPALFDVLEDLIPDVHGSAGLPAAAVDLAILVGDSPWSGRARRVVRLQADAWSGAIVQGSGARWHDWGSPFGALAAAGLAAGEVFKVGATRLRDRVAYVSAFDELFAPIVEATVPLAPAGTPAPSGDLGCFDCVSGGAIIQAALFALARIPGARGFARIIEPDLSEMSNLNRNMLLLRSGVGASKAEHISSLGLAAIRIEPVLKRFEASTKQTVFPLAPTVLVGVDDIPSRWEVQTAWPVWLGVGASTHYSSMASYHVRGLGCARCLHPKDDPGGGAVPTVSFVSHWAGLWIASLFAREVIGARPPRSQQSAFFTSLRADSPTALWHAGVPIRAQCVCREAA